MDLELPQRSAQGPLSPSGCLGGHLPVPDTSRCSAGANVNAKDTVWLTPLHRAAASRNEVGSLGDNAALGS